MHVGKSGLTLRGRAATWLLLALIALLIPTVLSAATPAAVTNYLKFVGGKPGKANPKLKPVVVGWVNQQGGQVQIGPLCDAGGRDRGEVRERQPRRHRRAPARAEEVLHQERRGRGHAMRPADGERQAGLGRALGRHRDREPGLVLRARGQEAGGRRSRRQPDRRAVQARVRHLRQRHVGLEPLRDVREGHPQGEERSRRLSDRSPASPRTGSRSSTP